MYFISLYDAMVNYIFAIKFLQNQNIKGNFQGKFPRGKKITMTLHVEKVLCWKVLLGVWENGN